LTGLFSSKTTPLADTFRVTAAISPLPVDKITGSASGKRTAQRTSGRWEAGGESADERGKTDFNASIEAIPNPKGVIPTLPEICLNSHGTKVTYKVTTYPSCPGPAEMGSAIIPKRIALHILSRLANDAQERIAHHIVILMRIILFCII
jgi:hypothetical protein